MLRPILYTVGVVAALSVTILIVTWDHLTTHSVPPPSEPGRSPTKQAFSLTSDSPESRGAKFHPRLPDTSKSWTDLQLLNLSKRRFEQILKNGSFDQVTRDAATAQFLANRQLVQSGLAHRHPNVSQGIEILRQILDLPAPEK